METSISPKATLTRVTVIFCCVNTSYLVVIAHDILERLAILLKLTVLSAINEVRLHHTYPYQLKL